MGHAFVMEEDGQTGSTAACETFASPVRHHPRLARAALSSGPRLTVCCVCVGQALLEAKDGRTRRPDEIITFGTHPFPPRRAPLLEPSLAESVRLLGAEIATSEVIILTEVAISF